MGLLSRLLQRKPGSEAALRARREWRSMSSSETSAPIEALRWVAVDTETSGLDPRRDCLISIGACAGQGHAINPHDSFEALLRQDRASSVDNVLIHGIGHAAQAAGEAPERVLASYLRYARADVIVGYHTLFDRTVLGRALRQQLGVVYRPYALDVALLLPVLVEEPASTGWDLDRWLQQFELRAYARHDALADAFATAQLFLVVLARARAAGLGRLADLLKAQEAALDWRALRQV